MASKFSINFTEKEHSDILNKVKNAKAIAVKVGFLESAAEYPDGTSVVDVAVWNEYGTDKIPSRPFFRQAWNANQEKYKQQLITFYKNYLTSKNVDMDSFFSKLGSDVQQDIMKSIVELREPPNAPATIMAKKSNNPLIDTSHMLESVSWEIIDAT